MKQYNGFQHWREMFPKKQMISEGSCHTENWSNYAENSALITGINYILQYIQIENANFKL